MGLLIDLLTLPLVPVRGVVWVADKVRVQAESEYGGRESIQARLAEVARARDAGEISDAEAAEREEQLLDELRGTYGEGYGHG